MGIRLPGGEHRAVVVRQRSGQVAQTRLVQGQRREDDPPREAKAPNPWGLYDMHGHVAEWCNDVYDKDYYQTSRKENPSGPAEGEKYVLRGGAWNSSQEACGSAYRVGEDPGFQDACFARDAIGFRCVRNAPKNLSPKN